MQANEVPTTYNEMFKFNLAVMGFGTNSWMNEVLDCFDNIVTNVANSARLQEECHSAFFGRVLHVDELSSSTCRLEPAFVRTVEQRL